MAFTQEQIKNALKSVKYPGFSRDIVSFGLVKEIVSTDAETCIQLVLTTNDPAVPRAIKADAENVLRGLGLPEPKVLIDIYGPSISLMFGSREQPIATEENRILPIEQYGLKLMSMGFLLDDSSPAILRGPMVTRYTQQFLRQVEWGELDVLVLDLPPGTGDIQLTIVQTVALAGAIVVTTPQEVALIDARKAATMFEKVNVPVIGLIENMSYFVSPSDQRRYEIFGSGGGEREAKRLRVPLLGQIPIDIATREAGDRGLPITAEDPNSVVGAEFNRIARELLAKLN